MLPAGSFAHPHTPLQAPAEGGAGACEWRAMKMITAVTLDGVPLSVSDLEADPALAQSVAAARRHQLLHSLRGCVLYRWEGGFQALWRHAALAASSAVELASAAGPPRPRPARAEVANAAQAAILALVDLFAARRAAAHRRPPSGSGSGTAPREAGCSHPRIPGSCRRGAWRHNHCVGACGFSGPGCGRSTTSSARRSMKLCVCKSVTYCSVECQRAHWQVHKPACNLDWT